MEADFYPLGMTNYPHFQQELHAGVNVLSLQRTTAFTLLNEAACCLLHTGVNRDFLLTQEIFCSGSTGNWRVCYEQNKPPEHSFGGTLYSFVLSTTFSRAIHCLPLCWHRAAKSIGIVLHLQRWGSVSLACHGRLQRQHLKCQDSWWV